MSDFIDDSRHNRRSPAQQPDDMPRPTVIRPRQNPGTLFPGWGPRF